VKRTFAQGVADDQSSEAFRSRRWHERGKPNAEDARIDARVCHNLSHAQTQIARGLAMNPKKLGKVDKTKTPWKLALP